MIKTQSQDIQVLTVTLNPAVDHAISISKFERGLVNRVEEESIRAGGKGINVAVALADHGISVAATGFLGQENVAIFEDLVAQKRIRDEFVRVAGTTRPAIKINDAVRCETTDINFPGIAPDPKDISRLYEKIDQVNPFQIPWVVISGSLPPSMRHGFYKELIERFRASGSKVLLDTSGAPLRIGIQAVPNAIKPNIHELEELVGHSLNTQASIVNAAKRLLDQGIELIAVSMGAAGAVFIDSRNDIFVPPPSVALRSTVGAGDGMVAGLIAGYLRQLSLAETADLARSFAAAVLRQHH